MGIPYGDYLASNGQVAIDREKANCAVMFQLAASDTSLAASFFKAQNRCQAECRGLTVLYRIDA